MRAWEIDAIARELAHGMPRRRLLGVVAVALARLQIERRDAAASCKNVGQQCDKDNDCCAGAKCRGGKCTCKSGFDECSGKCFNLDRDERHGGACDTPCGVGDTCCNGKCANLQFDPDHCGGCETVCDAGETCCDAACVDIDANDRNCGACGHSCTATEECVGGVCVTPPGDCASGADSGAGGDIPCGVADSGCICSQSTEGTTLCGLGQTPGALCCQCRASSDCASFGAGAFCVATGSAGCCGPNRQNVCRLPCGG